jgi:hypothetical protein
MLAGLITLTPGCRNKFTDWQKAKVRITVLPMMDVKTNWNWTLKLLECTYRLREGAQEWLKNLHSSDYRPLFTTQDDRAIFKYVMEV